MKARMLNSRTGYRGHGALRPPAVGRCGGLQGPRRQRGVSLVELLVSSAIGIFLTSGALVVYIESRDSILVSESIARVQENARFALAVLEPDVRAANYWGMHDFPTVIEGRATDVAPLNVDITGDCEDDFSLDLEQPLEGENGLIPGEWSCIADGDFQPLSDVLVVRHVEEPAVAAADLLSGLIYVRSDESPRGQLFTDAEPGGFSPFAENHALSSHVYYIRPWTYVNADGERDNLPSLRRQALARSSSAPALVDEEVIPGVEDMQIQFGVDLDDDDAANLYVDPDNDAVLDADGADVVSVRVWLLMRAENAETGYTDNASYSYADVTRTTGTDQFPADFRRVLVRRTIAVRNL
jgi:type IV pilus assembly protein PilW